MKTAAHQYEDKLLEFAYGELPAHEAEAVDAHVRACPRCTDALSGIRSMRSTMAELPMEEAPAAGLASLLAYAEQQAARNLAAAPLPWWRRVARARLVASLSSLAALVVVGVVAWRATLENPRTPAAIAVEVNEKREADSREAAPTPAPAMAVVEKKAMDAKAPMPKGATRASPKPPPSAAPQKQAEARQAPGEDSSGYGLASRSRDVLSRREEGQARAKDKVQASDEAPVIESEDAQAANAVKSIELSLNQQSSKVAKPARKVQERSDGAKAGSSTGAVSPSDDNAGPGRTNVEAARAAGLNKDVRAEVKFALAALAEGVAGDERLEMLNRVCSGYERLGEVELADPYCDRVLTEFPSSAPAAQLAAKRGYKQQAPRPASRSPDSTASEPRKR